MATVRDSRKPTPEGFLNVAKPYGWTSHDVVELIRRLAETRRVGHGGTLDPAATGVLAVAVGRATRLIDYMAGRTRATARTSSWGPPPLPTIPRGRSCTPAILSRTTWLRS